MTKRRYASARAVVEVARRLFAPFPDREAFGVVLLDVRHHVIGSALVSVGSLTGTLVHPREVFKPAVAASAYGVVAVHSHPSESPHPSQEDIDLTRTLMRAGDVLRIPLLDHVIIGLGTDAHASLCRLRLPDAWPGDVPVRRIHKNSTATRSKALRAAVWRCTGCDRRQTGLSRICRFCEAPADGAPEPAARPAKVLPWRKQAGRETAPPAAVRTRLRPDGGRG